MKKLNLLFVLLIIVTQTYGQNKKVANFSYVAYGDYFNRYVNGKKEGVWIETKKNIAQIGIYRNNKKDSIWQYYNLNTGELLTEKTYTRSKRHIRVSFGSPVQKPGDTLVHINFNFFDKTVSNDHGTWQTAPKLEDVIITVVNAKDSAVRNFSVDGQSIILCKHSTYNITFSRKGYISTRINVITRIPNNVSREESDTIPKQYIDIVMSNKVADNDPVILGKVSNIYKFEPKYYGLMLAPDKWYLVLQKRKLTQLDQYEKKQKVVDIENSVNERIINLQQEQLLLENQKKLKEEELLHQQEEIKRKQLELELLAKNKAVSDLTIKAKEAELLKNMLLANEKKKEIERLNQQKLIDELNIKNKEAEIATQKIESDNKQSRYWDWKKKES